VKVGTGELLIVLAVIILLFGARKLPDLARSLGASAREFRKGVSDGEEEGADDAAESAPDASDAPETPSHPEGPVES
jgi:sec-independent protein translocase protein TatA